MAISCKETTAHYSPTHSAGQTITIGFIICNNDNTNWSYCDEKQFYEVKSCIYPISALSHDPNQRNHEPAYAGHV